MIKLADKPNVQAPSPTFNYGSIIDDDGSGIGTPVNLIVYNDVHQFFETLMVYADVTPNGLIDNDDNGYQLLAAFQAAAKQATKALMGSLAETFIGVDTSPVLGLSAPYRLLGTHLGGSFFINPGYIYFDNELFFAGGWIGGITDTAVYTKVAPNVLVISDAPSGSGDFDWADLEEIETRRQNPNGLITKTIDIGVWDMDATASVSIPHGVTATKIRSVQVWIRDDTDSTLRSIWHNDNDGYAQVVLTNINIVRVAAKVFDSTSYDLTAGSYNRGFIVITYAP